MSFWWRWGRIERPVQKAATVHFYEHSRHFVVATASSVDEVHSRQLMVLSDSYEPKSRSTLTL